MRPEHLASAIREAVACGLVYCKRLREELLLGAVLLRTPSLYFQYQHLPVRKVDQEFYTNALVIPMPRTLE